MVGKKMKCHKLGVRQWPKWDSVRTQPTWRYAVAGMPFWRNASGAKEQTECCHCRRGVYKNGDSNVVICRSRHSSVMIRRSDSGSSSGTRELLARKAEVH
ncbi:unnamed protein product [Protopolystoma xenopodis]|uniref:Uncharacterized protein n=1 Tax=Protopolystoma xenopodis TaxID=117903 RepID=A0A448XMZ1_9PLAT|nr:unnamed protein product [Protopolystoma xenopodis]